MNWLLNLFKKDEPPTPIHRTRPAPTNEEELKFVITSSLNDVFLEAIKEAQAARFEKEKVLMDDVKLAQFIKNFMKYSALEADVNSDSFLVSCSNVEVPSNVFETFYKIIQPLCEGLGIQVKWRNGYISVDVSSFKRATENIQPSFKIDIDERTRAMLSSGIYR
jgi:hypothetical protein